MFSFGLDRFNWQIIYIPSIFIFISRKTLDCTIVPVQQACSYGKGGSKRLSDSSDALIYVRVANAKPVKSEHSMRRGQIKRLRSTLSSHSNAE